MFKSLSSAVENVLNKAQAFSKQKRLNKYGTEYILKAMYLDSNSICHFLFNEYGIDESKLDINYHIIRGNDSEVTKKLVEVIDQAKINASKFQSELVYDEHLFLALLEVDGTIARAIFNDLNLDVLDIKSDVYDIFDVEDEEDNRYTINISKKAKAGLLSPFVGRIEYIERLDSILRRKTKSNPLLIGSAGVGKTAIVEGLASYYDLLENDYQIISLDLGSCLAGSKYRGDFEERVLDVIKRVQEHENAILFIDEVHNLIGAGQSEGSMDAANLLKPILARGTIKCIGATTIEEYQKFIEGDKALQRRFQPIFVNEPDINETIDIVKGIKGYYEEYHKKTISDECLRYLVNEADYRISNRHFPDKAVDILDEALTKSEIKDISITNELIDNIIDDFLGVKSNPSVLRESLKKYALLKRYRITKKTLGNFLYTGGNEAYLELCKELLVGFGLTKEMILDIDLASYTDGFQKSNLIGSPPGYVGYDDGGILSKHLKRYPGALICLHNFDKGNQEIKTFFYTMMKKGEITDNKGITYKLNNVIFLVDGVKEQKKKVGFFLDSKGESFFDEIIKGRKDNYHLIKEKLKNDGYEVTFDDEIDENRLRNTVLEMVTKYPKGKYLIKKEEDKSIIIKT